MKIILTDIYIIEAGSDEDKLSNIPLGINWDSKN